MRHSLVNHDIKVTAINAPRNPAILKLIEMVIQAAKKTNTSIGLCGQAPSDYPEYAKFLVDLGIDSISFNPDALLQGIINMGSEKTSLMSEYVQP